MDLTGREAIFLQPVRRYRRRPDLLDESVKMIQIIGSETALRYDITGLGHFHGQRLTGARFVYSGWTF